MSDAIEIDPRYAGKPREHLLVALGDRQHGVVERQQLLALGFTRHEIDRMLVKGLLVLLHRGVYSVGRRNLPRRGRWMAAVLAAGGGAVLSHHSAAALFGLRVSERTIEVSAPNGRQRAGITIHRARLPPDETTVRDGIPTTTAARTLLDLAAVEPPLKVERLLHEAERLRLTDTTPLTSLLARYPRRPGTPALKQILTRQALGDDVTESELEDAFLAFLDEHDLPRPFLNRWIQIGTDRIRADAIYPDRRLIVELDGRGTHNTTEAFERDRARDRRLKVLGWDVIRITYRELHTNREALATDLRALLTTSSHPRPAGP